MIFNRIFRRGGFTLIELLVVIGIIAVLATMIIASLRSANEKARVAKAKEEFRQIETAAEFLEMDIGYYVGSARRDFYKYESGPGPNMSVCGSSNYLTGLCDPPIVGQACYGSSGDPNDPADCTWTQEKVNKWKGRYLPVGMKDPWGNAYIFQLICRRSWYLSCSNINEILGPYADPNVRGPCIVAMPNPSNRCQDIVYPILPDQ